MADDEGKQVAETGSRDLVGGKHVAETGSRSRAADWCPEDASDYGDRVTDRMVTEIAEDTAYHMFGRRFPPCWEYDDVYFLCYEIAEEGVANLEYEDVWSNGALFKARMLSALRVREEELFMKFLEVERQLLNVKVPVVPLLVDAEAQTTIKSEARRKLRDYGIERRGFIELT